MDLAIKTAIGIMGVIIVFCVFGGFYAYQFESKCRELGGVPIKGVCARVETIKVVY